MYDFLVVGAGPFGAAFARTAMDRGRTALVVDRRHRFGGNAATEERDGCTVHLYGAHIFHTTMPKVWEFVSRFATMAPYQHRVRARSQGRVYSFPPNLMTMAQVFGVCSPAEAEEAMRRDSVACEGDDAESHLVRTVGVKLYELFYHGYTRKMWQRPPSELPAAIVRRIGVRLDHDDSYFPGERQGIPIGGYSPLFEAMLEGASLEFGRDYFQRREELDRRARCVVYTGPIDRLFCYQFGRLEYRSLSFHFETVDRSPYGVVAMNHCDMATDVLRTIDHGLWPQSVKPARHVVSHERPVPTEALEELDDPQYPVGDAKNRAIYASYRKLADSRAPRLIVGGRLGRYTYMDMDQAIGAGIAAAEKACPL